MSKPLVVSIPHRLACTQSKHFAAASKMALQAAPARTLVMCSRSRKKSGPDLTFSNGSARRARVAMSGSIDVAEDYVRLEVFLPWLLAKLAETLQPLIRKEGTLLLEKK